MNRQRSGRLLVHRCAMILFGIAATNLYAQKANEASGVLPYMQYCSGCHGVDGKGSDKGIALVGKSSADPLSEDALIEVVRDGSTGGMPPFAQIGDANIRDIVRYLRLLQDDASPASTSSHLVVRGDVAAGRSLYFGKAQCSDCHMINGVGGFVASDLTAYGWNRGADAIAYAITIPDEGIESRSRVVSVTTKTGQKLTGVLRYEDNFSLSLQSENGRYYLLAKDDLREIKYSDHSLMPRDYGSRLTPKELDDLVSFLIVTGRSPRTNPSRNSMKPQHQ